MPDFKTQRFCAWSGLVGVLLFFSAFIFAQFIPPPGPYLTQEEVVAMYQNNSTGIRTGMLLMMISSMFISPWVALISQHLRRIEGVSRLMTYTQLSSGSVGILFFNIPAVLFLITAFRPDRSPELTYLMNDASWIVTVMVWPPAFMQNLSIGVAIMRDKSANPIFPRWLAFFQFWVCLLFVPGSFVPFFKSGPFAWNGLLSFWVAGSAFTLWFIVMLVMLLKAIDRQERDATA
jgi:hypothetical protein